MTNKFIQHMTVNSLLSAEKCATSFEIKLMRLMVLVGSALMTLAKLLSTGTIGMHLFHFMEPFLL